MIRRINYGIRSLFNFYGIVEAIGFYAKVFETEKPYIQTYGEVYQDNSEFNMPEEAKNLYAC